MVRRVHLQPVASVELRAAVAWAEQPQQVPAELAESVAFVFDLGALALQVVVVVECCPFFTF
ncbi:MAG: hypothetical protein GY869_12930 [Planctomycetes bacterium]|nr:hypothetical protein [Planctomycetota bacterium]